MLFNFNENIMPRAFVILVSLIWLYSGSVLSQDDSKKKYWPKIIPLDKASITIYSPEPESFSGDIIEVRSAFNYYEGTNLPVFGAMWLRARVHIDKPANHVFFDNIEMIDANFPDVTAAKKKNLQELIAAVAPSWQFNSSLDLFMQGLAKKGVANNSTSGLLNDPPNIFYEKTYTRLVYVDGEPIFENIDNSELYQYVVNTPYFIIRSKSDEFYYLQAGNYWFRTKDFYGEWQSIDQPPQSILRLKARSDEYKMQNNNELDLVNSSKPKLIVTIFPAQLIQTDGEPDLALINNTDLYEVKNSPNNLLYDRRSEEYYVLFSGRWYKSKTLVRGDWQFVEPRDIPAYFQKLPINSVWSIYRVSIPGTPEAMNAALDNGIPQTAIIDRQQAKLIVEYDGEPQFTEIQGTEMSYAINTDVSVVKINNEYFAVDEGVWFRSESPAGNWRVSTIVPDEIMALPPSTPVFNIKYVYIYESSADLVYTGYTGSFLDQGCILYGTGYHYKPWYKSKYYSRPMTFAFGVNRRYSKSNITIGVGVGYGGYPGFYAPYGYGYGFGSYGYASLNGNFEYKKGYERKPFDPNNIYKNRSQGVIVTESVRRNNPYEVLAPEKQDENGKWMPPANIYSTSNGDVYKKDDSGNWFKRADGAWVKSQSNPFETR